MDRRIFGLENEYGVTCTFRGQRRILSHRTFGRYLGMPAFHSLGFLPISFDFLIGRRLRFSRAWQRLHRGIAFNVTNC